MKHFVCEWTGWLCQQRRHGSPRDNQSPGEAWSGYPRSTRSFWSQILFSSACLSGTHALSCPVECVIPWPDASLRANYRCSCWGDTGLLFCLPQRTRTFLDDEMDGPARGMDTVMFEQVRLLKTQMTSTPAITPVHLNKKGNWGCKPLN